MNDIEKADLSQLNIDDTDVALNESNLFIKWRPIYETKHKIIDNQHKELVNIINELYLSTINNGESNGAFIKAVKKCIDYTQYHFKTEEKIMDLINYSDAENHKAMHKNFCVELVNQIRRYEEGQPFVANKFLKYLKDWLLEHIAFRDKIFVEEVIAYLKKNNI
ncbi:bacteriohemerythrin [uncultured Brachyspira sp.]|uniref:bacteriohemerythrin n=1 Tax=uncultured Brachyspira sp. TaxID=221953 RepID=UPI0026007D91|nr:bacteriohemerythrin [uncultured Brachyspira sp.]